MALFSPFLIAFGQHQSHIPAEERPATFTIKVLFFFERTTQDSARFIDIAEKYKATGPEGHSQEKEKENRTHPIGLGHQPGKLNNSTHPVGLGHQHGELKHSKRRNTWHRQEETKPSRPTT